MTARTLETSTVHPSLLRRKIIHFDMDAYYASIEMRDDPTLQGRPVVVGGSPNSRGVVCTANYEARKYGIKSAMACSQAFRLCPGAVFLKPNFAKYSAVSQQIREVFYKYTPLVEPLSLDEAYLDVTNNQHGLYAVKIARLIQQEVYDITKLTGSAGVGPNKLLAKIASDLRKPHGLTVVLPEQAESFMGRLQLRKIHGIGPVTEKRLQAVGFNLCRDVWPFSLAALEAKVGSMAQWLYDGTRGLDDRPVEPSWERKSLGREETFGSDLLEVDALKAELVAIAANVARDIKKKALMARTITLKVRYADFKRITRSRSLSEPFDDVATIQDVAIRLLGSTEAGRRKIRLLGISVSNLTE